MRDYKVGTFVKHGKAGPKCRKSHITAYTVWYNPSWCGCIEYTVTTLSGKEAKRLAVLMRLEHEHAGDPFAESGEEF